MKNDKFQFVKRSETMKTPVTHKICKNRELQKREDLQEQRAGRIQKTAAQNVQQSIEKMIGKRRFKQDYLPRCQMSRLYSAMVRSEENMPALAMFTRHFLRQPMGSQA